MDRERRAYISGDAAGRTAAYVLNKRPVSTASAMHNGRSASANSVVAVGSCRQSITLAMASTATACSVRKVVIPYAALMASGLRRHRPMPVARHRRRQKAEVHHAHDPEAAGRVQVGLGKPAGNRDIQQLCTPCDHQQQATEYQHDRQAARQPERRPRRDRVERRPRAQSDGPTQRDHCQAQQEEALVIARRSARSPVR